MPVKMTGAQYKAFLASKWGPDAYWDETEILRNGEPVEYSRDSDPDLYKDADVVTIVAGTIIPDQRLPRPQLEYVDAVKFARKWLKARSTVTLMVDVPREHADDFAERIGCLGRDGVKAKVVSRVG